MFSVIIPVYNGEKFIDNAIESVFSQTNSDWEIIVVNDGSSDKTQEILEKYRSHSKIRIINQENSGVSVARNNGFKESKGEYIAFLDADDVWHNNHLEVMADLTEKYPHAGLYGTFTRCELVNGDVIEKCGYFDGNDKEVYLEDFFSEYHRDKSAKMFTVITTCVSREAFVKSGGFPQGCKIGEDLELSLVIAAYYPVVLSPVATATYIKENSNATKTKSFDADWGFFERVNTLYEDKTIAPSKKENIRKVMEWFTMRRCRHYIIDGERKKAYKVYKAMNKREISKKDLAVNTLLLMLPTAIVSKIFHSRWRGKA
jgi:glycosyltransferase involved in cell wall biosynthesis